MSRTLPDDIGKIIGALGRVIREEGNSSVGSLLSSARVACEETSYDNWNGGTYGYTIQLEVPARAFAALGAGVDRLEQELRDRIEKFTRLYPNEHIEGLVIAPNLEEIPDSDGAQPATPPVFWQDGSLRLFLSHVSAFKAEASALNRRLAAYGVSTFIAHEDIEPTKEWVDEIRLALATCDALACLLTPGFNESKWTDQEVGFAVGRGTLVVPIRLGVDPYGFIARYQGYPGVGKTPEQLAEGVVEILGKHPSTRARMADALVTLFERSSTYAEAKARAKNLSLVRFWTAELSARLRRALQENAQISEAYGVPSQIERFLSVSSNGA